MRASGKPRSSYALRAPARASPAVSSRTCARSPSEGGILPLRIEPGREPSDHRGIVLSVAGRLARSSRLQGLRTSLPLGWRVTSPNRARIPVELPMGARPTGTRPMDGSHGGRGDLQVRPSSPSGPAARPHDEPDRHSGSVTAPGRQYSTAPAAILACAHRPTDAVPQRLGVRRCDGSPKARLMEIPVRHPYTGHRHRISMNYLAVKPPRIMLTPSASPRIA